MALFVTQNENGLASLPCKERTLSQLKNAGSPLAQEILALLSKKARYSHEIAKELNIHEQKIYYHIRKLEAAGLIHLERREERGGASAKYYKVSAPAFSVLLKKPEPTTTITSIKKEEATFLHPFIKDGTADFLIVIGSPHAHGPRMVQARDGGYAIDLALFLGSFLTNRPAPVVKLDTEFQERDWHRNLIVIGGPIVNTIAATINKKLPIRFKEDGKTIMSSLTGKTYNNDQIGIIVKGKNPRRRDKAVLLIAGRRQAGTKAAILAFLTHFPELIEGKKGMIAHIVEGRDLDSDGVIDDVQFRE